MNIRRGAIGDEALLANLNRIVQELHLARRPDQFKPTQVSELITWFRSLLEKPTTHRWIAEEDGLPVGYVLAIFHEAPGNPFSPARRWCEIDQNCGRSELAQKRHRAGADSKAFSEARTDGIQNVEAASWSFNENAHEVFRGLGFVPKTVRFELQRPIPNP